MKKEMIMITFIISIALTVVFITGCSEQTDIQQTANCGNKVVESGEECDSKGCPSGELCTEKCKCEPNPQPPVLS